MVEFEIDGLTLGWIDQGIVTVTCANVIGSLMKELGEGT